MGLDQQSEQDTYTVWPMIYLCLVCKGPVPTEPNTFLDQHGKEITMHSPASRYWLSKGHPNKNTGVFCCAQHAFDYAVTPNAPP